MAGQTVNANVAKGIRGGGQNGLAYGVVSWFATYHSLTPEQFGLAVLILGAVVTYAHNFLEDRGIIPALLKAEPPADPVPVVDSTASDAASKAVTKVKKTAAKKDSGESVAWFVVATLAVCAGVLLAHVILRATS